jgi:hypothetical protein
MCTFDTRVSSTFVSTLHKNWTEQAFALLLAVIMKHISHVIFIGNPRRKLNRVSGNVQNFSFS